ncbi:hypothetical protein COF68_05505 [Bacillus toyonensis]|uniref:hypothetical protein n=1 Tax=Bacillus toyonensis TaxID=155322 RepID=UPI000BFE7C16|nr:hypothetical protein [Bacillus toyonensis]PHE64299.1 hypothetical protein COF68_05505 [Bacillus toyonensis]
MEAILVKRNKQNFVLFDGKEHKVSTLATINPDYIKENQNVDGFVTSNGDFHIMSINLVEGVLKGLEVKLESGLKLVSLFSDVNPYKLQSKEVKCKQVFGYITENDEFYICKVGKDYTEEACTCIKPRRHVKTLEGEQGYYKDVYCRNCEKPIYI